MISISHKEQNDRITVLQYYSKGAEFSNINCYPVFEASDADRNYADSITFPTILYQFDESLVSEDITNLEWSFTEK